MRNKKRIERFLELVDNENLLTNIWKIVDKATAVNLIIPLLNSKYDEISAYWNQYSDLRYSQVLISLEIIPNHPGFWYYMEEDDILREQGIDSATFLLWGVNYDKDMNQLPETDYRFICDLETGHIQAILDGSWTGNPLYLKAFNDELNRRKGG